VNDSAVLGEKFKPYFQDFIKVKVKGKVVPVLFLNEHHAMKAY